MVEIRVKGPNADLYHKQKWWLGFADSVVAAAPWVLAGVALAVTGAAVELEPDDAQYVITGGLGAAFLLSGLYFWAKWYASRFK